MSVAKTDARGIIVTCEACAKKNRIPFSKLGKTGKCASCDAPLPPPAGTIEVKDLGHFDSLIAQSPVPVLVDFWATWCGPCLMVAPELEKVAASARGAFVVTKVNTEELPRLSARYGIRAIPTMALFSGGAEVNRMQGARPAHDIENFARSAL